MASALDPTALDATTAAPAHTAHGGSARTRPPQPHSTTSTDTTTTHERPQHTRTSTTDPTANTTTHTPSAKPTDMHIHTHTGAPGGPHEAHFYTWNVHCLPATSLDSLTDPLDRATTLTACALQKVTHFGTKAISHTTKRRHFVASSPWTAGQRSTGFAIHRSVAPQAHSIEHTTRMSTCFLDLKDHSIG